MKLSALSVLALTGTASAWYGQMSAGPIVTGEGGPNQQIYLTDYNTGSTYAGDLSPGFTSNGIDT
ncbi:hypothetical protein ACHAQJ_007101 [Trichoderma viride]